MIVRYRCVTKIGFSADIFLSFSFIFFRSIVVYLKSGSRLTFVWHFLIVFSCCIFLLYFLVVCSYYLIVFSYCIFLLYLLIVFSYCIFLLYCEEGRKEGGRKERRREGVGFTLKSNNPNQTGGEQKIDNLFCLDPVCLDPVCLDPVCLDPVCLDVVCQDPV